MRIFYGVFYQQRAIFLEEIQGKQSYFFVHFSAELSGEFFGGFAGLYFRKDSLMIGFGGGYRVV